MVVSGSADVHEGARAAVLQVDDLFRLDAMVVPDSLRLLVRNLCGAELSFAPGGYPHPVAIQGDLGELALAPGHHQLTFRLSGPDGSVETRVTLATLRLEDEGRVQMTAQAIVRQVD